MRRAEPGSALIRRGSWVRSALGALSFGLLVACDSAELIQPQVDPGVAPPGYSAGDAYAGFDAGTVAPVPVSPDGAALGGAEVATLKAGEEAAIFLEGHYTVSLHEEFRAKHCPMPIRVSHPYSHICWAWMVKNWTVAVPPSGGIPGPSAGYDYALGTGWRFKSTGGSSHGNRVVGPGVIEVWHRGTPGTLVDGVRMYNVQPGVKIRIRRKRKAELVLECNGARGSVSVERGGRIDCTAKTEPEGTPAQVTEWTFKGEGSTVEGPADAGTWGGTMVVGGTITVKATVDGDPQEASIGVVISPRNWAGKIQFPTTAPMIPSGNLQYPPISTVGENIADGVFGMHYYELNASGTFGVGTGPNANWWYFNAPPVIEGLEIRINPGLYPEDPFFKAQTGGRYCDAAFMRQARAFVEDHEQGHHEVASTFWSGEGPKLYEEARVYYKGSDISELWTMLDENPKKVLDSKQDAYHRAGGRGGPLRLTCTLNVLSSK